MEMWKQIKGYEGLYEVSNLGNVKSVTRKVRDSNNGREFTVTGKILKHNKTKVTERHPNARVAVELWKENKRKRMMVHRLVSEAFIPNPQGKQQINHIDGNPLNNNVENLEWVTNGENLKHAYSLNLRSKHNIKPIKGTNKITGEVLLFESVSDASRFFNVTDGAIRSALKGYGRSKSACGYTWEYQ